MENLIDIAALINAKTSVQEALMTEIRAGDRFFNNSTDSALVTGKSAWEMASNHDSILVDVTVWKQMHSWDSQLKAGKIERIKIPKKDSANTIDNYKNTIYPNTKW